ncbi:MAG: pilus assembly protein PilB, partial [Phycisphaerae bacterium]|nr:pilus assembly protein PilB [Phycisphaerae bacterium]
MSLSPDELINAAVSRSLISAEQVESLRLKAMRQRRPLVEVASHHARCPIVMLYCALAEQRGIPFIDLSTVTLDMNLVKRIPDALLKTRMVLPVADEGDEVLVATADPDDRGGLQNIARILGRPLRVALTDPDSLRETVKHVLAGQTAVHAAEDEDPVPICNRIFEQAYLRRASDIHLEAVPDGLRVRFRIDGRLQNYPTRIGQEMASSVISRMKVLSGLDIAEQRASQDGRFSFAAPGRDGATIDVRVATIPTRFGERITMRLLDSTATQLELGKIGMSDATLKRFRNMIQQPNGIVLMAGPTGSGKTSTLYAALEELNELHR